ncbi:MAG: alpha/beta hydrolase [Calditrichia bacterium]
MEFAFKHPEKLCGLVLSGCSTNPRGAITIPPRIGAFFTRILSERMLSSLNRIIFRRIFAPEIADPIIADGFYFRAVPQIVSEIAGRNFSKMVSGIAVPILFLNGEKDIIFRQDELVFLASAHNAKLEIIPGANHLCSLQKPAVFNLAIENFAAALEW